MRNYDYKKDYKIANRTEHEVAQLIQFANRGKVRRIEHNNDNKFDLKVTFLDGTKITIEIKEDFTCQRTGNVGLEYECRGKASGISVSQADVYLYKIHEPSGEITFWMIKTETLKKLIESQAFHRIVVGGDAGSNSKNYLFKLDVIKRNAELYHRKVAA